MPNNDDLFAGLEVNGKVIAPNPAVTLTPKLEVVDNSDLFEGLAIGGDVISEVTPQSGTRGFMDVITGSERIAARPELGTLPEFGTTKEGDTPRIAAGFLSTFDPKAQMDMIKQSIPDAKFETLGDGTTIIEVPTETGEIRRSVLNRPGLSPQDAMTSIAQVLSFVPAARLANLGKTLAAKIGIGAAGAGVTEQALQETGVALGREERDPLATGIATVTGGVAEAIVPAIQAVRQSRQAAKIGAESGDIAQAAENIQAAQAATRETGIPLFQAQQTMIPAQLEKQSFVSQLPAGTKSAVKGLKAQNEAAGNAVEKFINDIAPPEAVITGPEKVRTAAQNAVDRLKQIRAEKASPIYKRAFAEGADVDLKPINDLIENELAELPQTGEVAKSLNKIKSLIKGKDSGESTSGIKSITDLTAKGVDDLAEETAKPSLKLLHNAKLEIDQMLSKVGENSLGNTTKSKLTEVKDLLLQQMDESSDAYRLAREEFAANSPAVTKIQDSIIGKIASLKDDQLKQVASKIFDPAQTNPQVIIKAKKAIQDVDPDAWNEIVRVELERRLGSVKSVAEAGNVENIPGQMYRALFPNDKSNKVLMNALDGDARKNMLYLKSALSRAKLGRQTGSQTAAREEIKKELRGGFVQGIRGFVGKPISQTVQAGITTATGSTAETAFNRRVSSLAKALFDPSWKAEMQKIRALNPNSPASARAITQLLNDIEQSEAKKSNQ